MKDRHSPPRILVFSQRNLSTIQPFRCAHFEFEDVISTIDRAEVLAPSIQTSNRRYMLAKQLGYHSPLKLHLSIETIRLQSDYDLFFAVLGNPTDLLRVNAIQNWRDHCKKAVCLIDEIWVREINQYRKYLQALKQFDFIVSYYSHSVNPINQLIGDKCAFLPPGVDTLRFCPFPNPPEPTIDIYSVGRRSSTVHDSLLKMVRTDGIFYLYDSISADRVPDPIAHRTLFADIAKRSRYFIVNPGLIDRPEIRGKQIEIGNRYFEGAAAGCILLGERPINSEFDNLFDWSDSLVDLPYHSSDAERIIKKLDGQHERQNRIRRMNARQCLLRHDWVYRWEAILNMAGIAPLQQLEARKHQLQDLAQSITLNGGPPSSAFANNTQKPVRLAS
jgi:hypothetical protein